MAHRTFGMTMVAALALLQGIFGVLRAFHWFGVGSDFMGQGLLLLPIVGVMAWLRGVLVVAIALLYGAFALGVWFRREWASTLGWVAAVVNILLVLSVLVQGEAIGEAFLWLIVPVIIICYLLLPTGRRLSQD